jgi:glycosyltransferase involved in cell wall biosynthesis
MLRIHVLYEHGIDQRPHGTAYIRLLLPLTHPANEGAFGVTSGCEYAPADIVIVERMWKPDITLRQAEAIVARTRGDGACLICTLDDNLLDLQTQDGSGSPFSPEKLMVLRYLIRAADGVIVSTVPLKRRLARLNANIHVVPNALDERLCRAAAPSPGAGARKIIGYMGTYTHDADFMMILQPLRELLRKYREAVEFQLVGSIGDAALLQALAGLPVRVLDVTASSDYLTFMRWMTENARWDLAIAPLEDTPFTACKSDIKALDYGIRGIPGIFSRVPAYETTIRHLETGWLAGNDVSSWQTAFETLLHDDQLRQQLARNVQEYSLSTRTLQHCAPEWRAAILNIYQAHRQRHDRNLLA